MSKKNLKGYIFSFIALTVIVVGGIFGAGFLFRGHVQATHASGGSTVSVSAKSATAAPSSGHSLNVYKLATTAHLGALSRNPRQTPLVKGVSSSTYQQWKTAAQHSKTAPAVRGATDVVSPPQSATQGFQGMADSPTICPYFGGCQPPDQALATSPNYVFQGVNTSFALYSTSGKLVAGPVTSQMFFGVPNPPANCDPNGPFLSDPRAFYDPNTGLMWAATLQVEGAFGVGSACPLQSLYWIAVFNPNTGVGYSYSFDMQLGTTNVADYTQFGFNKTTVAFSGNMFNQAGTAYVYAETLFVNKHALETGVQATPTAFSGYTATGPAGTVLLDTVQPVETLTPANQDPGVLYLINSFNSGTGEGDPFGNDCVFTACHGFVVWAYDAHAHTLMGSLVTSQVPDPAYVLPPNADQPGAPASIETLDTRISGTPVYSNGGGNGLISFALETAVNNSTSVVPGILWGQVQPFLSSTTLIGATVYQTGYLAYSGDRAASFGAVTEDKTGRLVMVFDTMSANINPSIMVTSRRPSDPIGFLANPRFVYHGPTPTLDSRWGDYEAASYDGFSTNHIWIASQYSNGDWATFIERV